MILIEATIKYKGYDPNSLSKFSKDRVCVSCDSCGKVRWIRKDGYRDLCGSCSQKGKNVSEFTKHKMSKSKMGDKNHFYGKNHSDESKELMSKYQSTCIGNKNHFYGKHHTKESKEKMRDNRPNMAGKNHPNWKGGIDRKRSYLLPEIQCRKMNQRFTGSEFHHLSKSIGVYIPKELHRHLYHNLKNGKNMGEMSVLAFQYIKGEL